MTKIRVGIIGLSTNSNLMSVGSWGVLAHLRPIQALAEYEIVAVANSSVESAKKSIRHHQLPAETRAYGSPQDIAEDPNVDLVVVSVNVAKHFHLAKPALENKKHIFVEWPLGASPQEAEALTELAAANNVRTMVGLQSRADPVYLRLREILRSDELGKVISSTVTASTSSLPVDKWMKGGEYFLDFKSGGNEFTIAFGHFLDAFTYVLGDFSDVHGILKSYTTTVSLIDFSNGEMVDPAYPKTSPDHIFVQGTLETGAVASITFRKAKSAADDVAMRWVITGTKGELILVCPEGSWMASATKSSSTWSLKMKTGDGNNAREIDLTDIDDSPASRVEAPGTNTARLYQSFAAGSGIEATFESANKTHRLLDRIAKSAGWEL